MITLLLGGVPATGAVRAWYGSFNPTSSGSEEEEERGKEEQRGKDHEVRSVVPARRVAVRVRLLAGPARHLAILPIWSDHRRHFSRNSSPADSAYDLMNGIGAPLLC